ncbi:MAG TPA: hypothetical protein VN517_09195 [Terriglobales bacterium]|nr:hypothetical protein [Terriglobales bacterium]
MATFCVKCGTALGGGPFCVKCGADARMAASSPPDQASTAASQPSATGPQPVSPAQTGPTSLQSTSPKTGMSPLAKLAIVVVVIIFVGGAAGAVGMYYLAHRVSQKFHQISDGVLGPNSDASNSGNVSSFDSNASSDNSLGDVCRFLSKEDVSKAIGVEIIRTKSEDNGCSYIAKGDQADIMAKHASAMTASRGADKKTQQIAQQFAGGMFKEFQSERPQSEQDNSGEVPVFNFSVDQHAAEEQMRLNAKALSILGDIQGLPGIGDQAFVSSDGMIMVRKGNKLIRIMYITCPCGTEAVEPLAKKLADSL